MQSSHTFTAASAVFDEYNLVSAAGLVPVLELGEQAGLSELIDAHVDLASTRVASGAANPAGKLTSIIGGMLTGADSVDDVDTIRAGGTPLLPGIEDRAFLDIDSLLRPVYGHQKQGASYGHAKIKTGSGRGAASQLRSAISTAGLNRVPRSAPGPPWPPTRFDA